MLLSLSSIPERRVALASIFESWRDDFIKQLAKGSTLADMEVELNLHPGSLGSLFAKDASGNPVPGSLPLSIVRHLYEAGEVDAARAYLMLDPKFASEQLSVFVNNIPQVAAEAEKLVQYSTPLSRSSLPARPQTAEFEAKLADALNYVMPTDQFTSELKKHRGHLSLSNECFEYLVPEIGRHATYRLKRSFVFRYISKGAKPHEVLLLLGREERAGFDDYLASLGFKQKLDPVGLVDYYKKLVRPK